MSPLPTDVPVELGRKAARQLAEEELSKSAYRAAEPGPLQRAGRWLVEQLAELLGRAADASPGGAVGLVALAVLVVLAVVVLRARLGPLRAPRGAGGDVFAGGPLSAAEHRLAADQAAARGDWSTAVVERFRALARALEERGLLDPRPGRTADEVAADAGAALPRLAADLAGVATLFDAVRYGGRTAGPADDERLRVVDAAAGAEPAGRRDAPRTHAGLPR